MASKRSAGPSGESNLRRVAVIGAGIAGLSAAFRLCELSERQGSALELAVFERAAEPGGSLKTRHQDGFVIEQGADSFLSEKPEALALIKRLGLEGELIGTDESNRKTCVVHRGRLTEVPEGFLLLAPARLWPVLKTPLLSPLGKLRLALEPFVATRRNGGDESLASFVRRRLGGEVLERIAQPLAGGVYTADPEQLSMEATMPRFLAMERRYGSIMRGLREVARLRPAEQAGESGARFSLFLSFKGGMGALASALSARLDGKIRCGAPAVRMAREAGGRWKIELGDGAAFEADAVICAAPAYVAAALIRPHHRHLAELLDGIKYASTATVNLAFRATDFARPPACAGFVVPAVERRKIIAVSFSSLKFAHRAPPGNLLMRVFFGGALQEQVLELDDQELLAAARQELRTLMGVTVEPLLALITRWPKAMPQYAVGHLARVAEIEQETAKLDGFALAGSAYRGIGVPDCIRSGEQAAEAVFSAARE